MSGILLGFGPLLAAIPFNPLLSGSCGVDKTLTPTSLGMKSAELRIFSNDPATPTRVVQLRANVVSLSPCTGLSVLEP